MSLCRCDRRTSSRSPSSGSSDRSGPRRSCPPLDLDWRLRLATLDRLRRAGDGLVTGAQLTDGFEFEGERIPFFNLRMGIWKPRQADSALTIVTVPPKPGKKPPYDDQVGSDADWFLYRYQGTVQRIRPLRAPKSRWLKSF